MKPRFKQQKKDKKRRAEVKEIMDEFDEENPQVDSRLSENDVQHIHDIARESRMNELLIEDLKIDEEELEKAKKKIIKLSPYSRKFKFRSVIYKDLKGFYKVEVLLNLFHDSILKEGINIGMEFGTKFLIEDIQNKRFSKEDIMNMTPEEIDEYCEEVREEI